MKRGWVYKQGRYEREPPLWPWTALLVVALMMFVALRWL